MLAVLSPSLEASRKYKGDDSSPSASPPPRERAGSTPSPPTQRRESFVAKDRNRRLGAADADWSQDRDEPSIRRPSGPIPSGDRWAPSGQNRGSASSSSHPPRLTSNPNAPVSPHPKGTRAPPSSSKAQSSSTGQSSSSSLPVAQPVGGFFSSFLPQLPWSQVPAAIPVSGSSGISKDDDDSEPESQHRSAWDNLPVQKKKELYGRLSKQGDALAAMLSDKRFIKNRSIFISAIDQFARESNGDGIPHEYAAIPLPQTLTQLQLENLKDLLVLQYYDENFNINGRIKIPSKYVYPLYSHLCAGNTSFLTEAPLDERHIFKCRLHPGIMKVFKNWFYPLPNYMADFGIAVANEPHFVTPNNIITASFLYDFSGTITAKGETIFSQFHRAYVTGNDGEDGYLSNMLNWILDLPDYQSILKGLKIRGDALNRNAQFYGKVRQLAEESARRLNADFKRDDAKWLLSSVAPELMPQSIRRLFTKLDKYPISGPTWFAEFFYTSEAEIKKILGGEGDRSFLGNGVLYLKHNVTVSDLATIVDIFTKDPNRRHSAFLALRTFGLLPTYKRGKTNLYTAAVSKVLLSCVKQHGNKLLDSTMIEFLMDEVRRATGEKKLEFSDEL